MTERQRVGKYPAKLRDRAVRMVFEAEQHCDSQWEAISSVAEKLGPTAETVRKWVRRVEIDEGRKPGLTSDERERLKTGAHGEDSTTSNPPPSNGWTGSTTSDSSTNSAEFHQPNTRKTTTFKPSQTTRSRLRQRHDPRQGVPEIPHFSSPASGRSRGKRSDVFDWVTVVRSTFEFSHPCLQSVNNPVSRGWKPSMHTWFRVILPIARIRLSGASETTALKSSHRGVNSLLSLGKVWNMTSQYPTIVGDGV